MPWGVVASVAGAAVSSALAPSPAPPPSGGGVGQVASGVAQSIGGALSANQANTFGNQVAQTADPFLNYSGTAATTLNNQAAAGVYGSGASNPLSSIGQQLSTLASNPNSYYSSPMYQAQFNQGMNAVNATQAAEHLTGSGAQDLALEQYGMSNAQSSYNNELSNLSGVYNQSLATNNQNFNQGALMSGLTGGAGAAAASAQSNIFANVNSAYGGIGSGIANIVGGLGGINGIGSAITNGINNIGNSNLNTSVSAGDGAGDYGSGSGEYDSGSGSSPGGY